MSTTTDTIVTIFRLFCFQKSNYKKFFDDTTTYPSDGFDVSKFPWTYGVNWDKTAPIVAAKVKMNSEEFKNLAEARLNCQIVAA